MVLDDRRVSEGRRDCCFWSKAKDFDVHIEKELLDGSQPLGDRFMLWYAKNLLRPWVKLVVAVGFAVLTVMAALSASKLTQAFEAKDVLPRYEGRILGSITVQNNAELTYVLFFF